MSNPVRVSDTPYIESVEAGKTYMWCACGKSSKQPFCDGSHAGTGMAPTIYKATETRNIMFCGCKQTKKAPICDGSHSK
ncbi:MAG: glutamate synthase [Kangiella sp.]|nr:MAG: glutamate synthase [Kangiella sp.]